MVKNFKLVFLMMTLFSIQPALAGTEGFHASIGGMALSNSTEQGGTGPSGSTILTQTDAFYNFEWVGFGLFMQYDIQGASQEDFALGPKMEGHWGPFFIDLGFAMIMRQAFKDRAITSRTGSGFYMGLGFRFVMNRSPGEPSMFLQFSYKFRTVSLRFQDDSTISENILQKDNYPIFSFGYVFK